MKLKRLIGIKSFIKGQRGITGLETAIVLIAFVVVSSVFAFASLSTGLFSSDKAREAITAGLDETRGTMELRGAMIAEDTDTDTTDIDKLIFQVANAAGGGDIDLSPGKTTIRYTDKDQTAVFDDAGEFTLTKLGNSDTDNLLEVGEIIEIQIPNLETTLSPVLGTSKTFTIEVVPPQGAVLFIERTTPAVLEKYNDLG